MTSKRHKTTKKRHKMTLKRHNMTTKWYNNARISQKAISHLLSLGQDVTLGYLKYNKAQKINKQTNKQIRAYSLKDFFEHMKKKWFFFKSHESNDHKMCDLVPKLEAKLIQYKRTSSY